MMLFEQVFFLPAFVLSATAAAVAKPYCPKYVLINARGTGEPVGESSGFAIMNQEIQSKLPGGTIYNVDYPAAWDQNSTLGTTDIVNHVHSYLAADPKICIVLQGYSQGAVAVVDAMPKLTGAAFKAVKAVVVVGDPEHKAGLAGNVDENGSDTTKHGNGVEIDKGGVPEDWVWKTLDICWLGDGVCDTSSGRGIVPPHALYPFSSTVQNMGAAFVYGLLRIDFSFLDS